MTRRTIVLLISLLMLGLACCLVTVGFQQWVASQSSKGIDNPYSQRQNIPSFRVNTEATASISPEAVSQRRYEDPVKDWPEFRGANRIARVDSVRLAEDWEANPPREVWRIGVGEAWSSVAVAAGRIYTQEQRDDVETVACYDLADGAEIWKHGDSARLADSESLTGPRATPTCADGKVITLGATGILNCLDQVTGDLIWTVDLVETCQADLPPDGYTCSPLVIDDLVIVVVSGLRRNHPRYQTAGSDGQSSGSTCAFRIDSGKLVWHAGKAFSTFSSPHWASFHGRPQILVASDVGVESFEPATGELLWVFESAVDIGTRMLQPAVLDDNSFLLPTQDPGVARIAVTHDEAGWNTELIWESNELKPYTGDLTVYRGHIFGIGEPVNVCLDLSTGELRWKQGRFGGQLLLFADSGHQIILAGDGRLVLQRFDSQKFVELASIQAIDGSGFAHLAYYQGYLVVRSRREMACFELMREDMSGVEEPSS